MMHFKAEFWSNTRTHLIMVTRCTDEICFQFNGSFKIQMQPLLTGLICVETCVARYFKNDVDQENKINLVNLPT